MCRAERGGLAGTLLLDEAGKVVHLDEGAQATLLTGCQGRPLGECIPSLRENQAWNELLRRREAGFLACSSKNVTGVAVAPTDGGFLAAVLKPSIAEAAFEATPEMMMVVDETGRVVEANERTEARFRSSGGALGRKLSELIPVEALSAMVNQTLSGMPPELDSFEWQTPAGPRVMEVRCSRVHHLPLCALTLNDVTTDREKALERERLLEAVHQSQKLDAIGQLASGVAHDMNNVLAVVQTCAGALRDEVKEPLQKADAEQILLASQRARDLLHQLLAFARKTRGRAERFDVAEMVREATNLVSRLLPPNVRLVVKLPDSPSEVTGDRSQLQQAVLNVCLNSRDAMPHGGTITVSLSCHKRRVTLVVTDTGQGMTPDVLQRAFEPFFSTKKRGSGTGLGLSMAYTSIRAHRGDIRLESEVGRGTTVTMWLPKEVSTGDTEGTTPVPVSHGMALVVDDDEVTRKVLGRFLRKLGYSVQLVASGEEALSLLRGGLRPKVVVCDLVMPGMDGNQTMTQLKALEPHLKFVITSGFLDDKGESEVRSAGADVLLKPFSMDDVAQVLATFPQ